ncbi:MAG: antitoxin VapB family protein, partial [Methanosarcinales archaeon]
MAIKVIKIRESRRFFNGDKMAINISISDAAYKVLLREKRENESISDVILRIADVVGTNILKEEDWN